MSTSPHVRGASAEPSARPERRRNKRSSVVDDAIVPVSLAGDNGGLVLDLCESGLAVQAVARLQQGATTEVKFALPEIGANIHARGEVRWAEESGRAGIRILAFEEGSSAQIGNWLARAKPKTAVAPPAVAAAAPPALAPEMADIEREIAARSLDLDGALQWIAERTLQAAHATGTAIALGTRQQMVCRASSGAAPSLGVLLNAESGLSGECVRTGMLVRCDDTETDARVDAAVCRSLDLRAAVLVPIFDGEEVRGVLEVFSNRPRAFGTADLHRFRETSTSIATLIARLDPRAEASPKIEAAAAVAAVVAVPAGPVAPAIGAAPVPAVVAPLRQPASSAAAPAPAPIPQAPPRERAAGEAPKPVFSAYVAEPVVTEARKPETLAASAELLQIELPKPARSSISATQLALVGAGLVALMGGTWAFVHSRPAAKPAPAVASRPAPTSAPSQPVEVTALPALPEPTASPKPPAKATNSPGNIKEAGKDANIVTKEVVAALPRAAIRRPATETAPDVAPPSLVASSASASLPALTLPTPAAPSAANQRRSEGVVPGHLLRRVEPIYPDTARHLQIRGDVVLNAIVRTNGSIGTVQVVSGNAMLARAAVDAVRQWRYEPYRLNGSPVEATVVVRLHFGPAR